MTAVEKANVGDAKTLDALTMRSKSFWGYSEKQLEEWKDDLEITPDYIRENEVYLVRVHPQIIGYYSFQIMDKKAKLDNVFLAPDYIGKGLGRILMNDLLKRMVERGITTISLEADPYVENFYLKFGFKTVGKLRSSVPGRYLPVMEVKLADRKT